MSRQQAMVVYTDELNSISLDRKYLLNLAQGKSNVFCFDAFVDQTFADELIEKSKRSFDFDHYFALLNDCKDEEAYAYKQAHEKDSFLDLDRIYLSLGSKAEE